MKRTWLALMVLVLLVAPATVQAQFTYTTNDGGIIITGYSGTNGVVTIPSSTNGLPVTGIAARAFIRRLGLTTVTIPESVITIGEVAFASCPDLTNVTILPGSLITIGDVAFSNCISLTNFTMPAGVTSIGMGAFEGAGLGSVTIPGSVTNFGTDAFSSCRSLTNATIDFGVTNIAAGAFGTCTSLASVAIPASVTGIGVSAFYACAHLTNITIPGAVTNLGALAFWYCTNIFGVYFAGNAPTVAGDVFAHDPKATAYYLPGTTGWADFSDQTGLTPVLWNPTIQTGVGGPGVRNDRFGFNITGTSKIPIVVEACSDLANPVWMPLEALTLTNGLVFFSDSQWTNYACRFYGIGFP
jgi:hypothetical protein